ncbi:MAG: phosphopentomutase, partial [Candidatus Eremiobacteraeota bacterium]|nr:phosphopentomutase [Candidatus Eremiobacteraeota bacterium]
MIYGPNGRLALTPMPRHVTIVLDSAGVGALPDAASYGDAPGANTIANTAVAVGNLNLPHFEQLGLGNVTRIAGVSRTERSNAAFGRLAERSRGKDTITGHWEMVGIITALPFPTYPHGFPPEVVEMFTQIAGAPLGNEPA